MEGFTKGYKIAHINIDEHGQFRNTVSIDLEVTDEERASLLANNGRWSGMIYAWPRENIPTQIGWFSLRAKNELVAEDDNTIEVVLENVPLLWNVKHEIHISIVEHNFRRVTRRARVMLPFNLTDDFKETEFPEIRDLQIASDVKPYESPHERVKTTAKIKVRWFYDFVDNKDAWFYVHHSNVRQWRSERICRANSAGRCSAWVHIMKGQNNIQVQAYDPATGETGKVAEIPYNYVVSE